MGDLYLERADDVREYEKVFGMLLEMTLNGEQTNDLITKLAIISDR